MLSMQMHSPLIMAWTLGLLVAEPMTQIACLNPTVVNTTMNSSLTFVSRIIDQPDSGWISKSLLEKNLFLFYYFHFFLNWDACIMYMCIKLLTCICSCILVRRYPTVTTGISLKEVSDLPIHYFGQMLMYIFKFFGKRRIKKHK